MWLVESLAEYYPESLWQRCTVHFYRNVFTNVPSTKVKEVAAMLKAIHAQEDREAALDKAATVVEKLMAMKLHTAAKTFEEGILGTLTTLHSIGSIGGSCWRTIRWNASCGKLGEGRGLSAIPLTGTRRLYWLQRGYDVYRPTNGGRSAT
jgi:transposase-like protein